MWARDIEAPEDAAEYDAHDVQSAAEIHASYGHNSRDFWECTWPLVFMVIDPTGKTFAVEVEREMVPEFNGGKPAALVDLEPAIHITENENGTPLCRDVRLPPGHSRNWPEGQHAIPYVKVTDEKLKDGACDKCVKAYRARMKFMAEFDERERKARDAAKEQP